MSTEFIGYVGVVWLGWELYDLKLIQTTAALHLKNEQEKDASVLCLDSIVLVDLDWRPWVVQLIFWVSLITNPTPFTLPRARTCSLAGREWQ
jgi:hypothetical protein